LAYDASAGAQDVAGDGQLVGGGANISDIVVEDEVFEMDQFAVDPQRGTGVGEMGPFDPACADRRAGDALVNTGQRRCWREIAHRRV
jgi:hypothetical protein